MHLPGCTNKEYATIYQPLKIKGENIVGVECDPDAYTYLNYLKERGENKDPQFSVPYVLHKGFIEDYIATTTRKFDVISLDTTQNFSMKHIGMFHDIFDREIAKEKFILQTVFVPRREKFLTRSLYEFAQKQFCVYDAHPEEKNVLIMDKNDIQLSLMDEKITREIDYRSIKDYIITQAILAAASTPMNKEINEMGLGPAEIVDRFKELQFSSLVDSCYIAAIYSAFFKPWLVEMIERYSYKVGNLKLYVDLIAFNRHTSFYRNYPKLQEDLKEIEERLISNVSLIGWLPRMSHNFAFRIKRYYSKNVIIPKRRSLNE